MNAETEYFIDANDVEKIFFEDSINKKLINYRTIKTKRSYMPTKKQIEENQGVVKVSNIYDEVMGLHAFKAMEKEERKKVINEYWKRYSAAEIGEVWEKNRMYVHDLHYRLNRDQNQPVGLKRGRKSKAELEALKMVQQSATLKPTNKIEVKKTYPLTMGINKIITGEQIQDLIMKLVELFEEGTKIAVELSIKKVSQSKIMIAIEVNDKFEVKEFSEDILNTVSSISKTDNYYLKVDIQEVK